MRRAVFTAAVVAASVPLAPATAGAAVQAAEVCRIADPAVTEVSGLAVVPGGFLVENDSNPDPRRTRIFYLDEGCRVTRSVGYPTTARDPEDLAVDRSGTVWVADIGDNSPLMGGSGNRRSTIALWTLPRGAKSPKIHRLRYPDGEPRDAEALLIDGAGRPVIVTKEPGGEVYRLDTPLPTDNAEGAPLTLVGRFQPSRTGTANPLGVFGSALITGAAVSPDGTKAVVRTYSDAYEFDVTGGDVAAAITGGTPVVTPLPDEPQGEAIAYTADGNGFLTVSDQPGPVSIRHYPATRKASPEPAKPAPSSAAALPPPERPARQGRMALLVGAFGVVGLMLVAAAARYARRRR
ncbi:hypothetical protein KZZ52_12315 [Dactylosporangium sp. AC04546]|uniref:hypothetical protein n=1 Tax=Dactylosporangium sp. AC04546 TaxID=2862460 RepID=UPI001EDFB286|nr:hypothetical protein [Dactylosporangium sp. AC04546]WVK86124.1 hypothetical protein KZZ52_12315 [Dactylosporangium sp. AC04546]